MSYFKETHQPTAVKSIIEFQGAIEQILQAGGLRGRCGICRDASLNGSADAYEIMYDLIQDQYMGEPGEMTSHRILFCLFLTEVSPTELLEMVQA
jgi:hypothetical protein